MKHRSHLLLAAASVLAISLAAISTRADTLYVANSGDRTIKRFTPDGSGSLFATSALDTPLASPLTARATSSWPTLGTTRSKK